MLYIFLFFILCIYYYKIILFNIVVKRHEQLVDVSAIKNFFGKNKWHLGERERRRLLPFNLV